MQILNYLTKGCRVMIKVTIWQALDQSFKWFIVDILFTEMREQRKKDVA